MRKLLMFSFFSALISVISCVDEVDGLSGFVDGDVRFEASFSAVSKAVLEPGADGSKVAWESGDKVGILVGGGQLSLYCINRRLFYNSSD